MSSTTLQGRTALVTGAGSGLGAATARALAQAGCVVACLDRDAAGAEETARRLTPGGGHTPITCDVTAAEQVERAVERAIAAMGRLDFLVNCAAVDHTYPVEELSVAQWDQVIAVNLRGCFLTAHAALPQMRRQGGGHIINIASTAAVRAWANASAYHASKWGLIGFSRGLGVEGRPHNIRVTTLLPGGMRTRFFDRFVEQGIPMPDERNLQDPAVVADTIVFVLSVPQGSVIQELLITPMSETSWP